jgi:hypothetical protein
LQKKGIPTPVYQNIKTTAESVYDKFADRQSMGESDWVFDQYGSDDGKEPFIPLGMYAVGTVAVSDKKPASKLRFHGVQDDEVKQTQGK